MTTDLFGRPLEPAPEFKLNLWQKRQATLLYHWMGLDYLKGLKAMIDALIQGADVTLALAQQQGRDAVLSNPRWGVRDTAANWSTNVYPALEDFRVSTIRLMAARANDDYSGTGATQCARMLSEHSSLWMTQEEEERFNEQFERVCRYASWIDDAAGVGGRRPLKDYGMHAGWQEFGHLFPRLPKFCVRTDIQAETGLLPPRTGVYVAQDDEYATLQFAWTGNRYGALGPAQTFNQVGRDAALSIGQGELWSNGVKAVEFLSPLFRRGELTDRGVSRPGDEHDPEYAVGVLSANVFSSPRPCKWYLVEKLDGRFEDEEAAGDAQTTAADRASVHGGQPCPRSGWWFTPAKAGSRRHFQSGEVMPDFPSDWGQVIWQWDANQGGQGD